MKRGDIHHLSGEKLRGWKNCFSFVLFDIKERCVQIHHLVWYEDGRARKEKNYANKLTTLMII